MADKWKRVAEALASRLVNHAFCGTHRVDNPNPDCPFCEDTHAYPMYLEAGGRISGFRRTAALLSRCTTSSVDGERLAMADRPGERDDLTLRVLAMLGR